MNYFICRTPLHFLLANIFDCSDKKIVKIAKSKIILKSSDEGNEMGIIPFLIKIWIKRRKVDNIFIFNDSNLLEHLIYKFSHRNIRFNYIEDGEAAYNNHKLKYKSSFLIRKIDKFLGRKLYKRIGHSHYFKKGYYFFPDYIVGKKELSHEVNSFPVKKNYKHILESITDNIPFDSSFAKPEALILSSGNSKLNGLILEYVTKNCTSDLIIKEHPLVNNSSKPDNTLYVNNLIPAELMPVAFPSLKYIFGYRSTSLYMVKTLFPGMNINLVSNKEVENQEFYIHSGVNIIQIDG